MDAVILAAGRGRRLEPITSTRLKANVPILGRTLLERTVSMLKPHIDTIYIVVPSEAELKSFKPDRQVKLVKQGEGYGSGAGLRSTRLKAEFIVLNGDILFEEKALKELLKAEANAMVGVSVPNPTDYGVLDLDSRKRLISMVEKPSSAKSRLINAGMYRFSPEIYKELDKTSPSARNEFELVDAITRLVKRKGVNVIKYDGIWLDIGKPWNLLEANRLMLEKEEIRNLGEVEKNVSIEGKVIIEEGARVKAGTHIEGPAYIGANSHVGPNAHLRPYSVIGNDCKIGAFVEIKNSVIMERAKVPHLSYVGDSIICEDANVAAGTITANLRFDGKNIEMNMSGKKITTGLRKFGCIIGARAKIGINVSIMPGIKIGADSTVYPGSVVNRDVEHGEFFRPGE